MKLKKIASLALAGIMAVSMLTACNGSASSEQPPVDPVEPVDTSFATAVNDEMSGAHKAVLTFDSDATLANVLEKVADKISSYTLADSVNNNHGFVLTSDARDFRHLLGIGRDNSLTAYPGFGKLDPIAYIDNTTYWNWDFFKGTVDSSNTIADLVVVPGGLTEEGVAEVCRIC